MAKVDFSDGMETLPAALLGNPGAGTKKARQKNLRESRQTDFSRVLESSISETPDLGPLAEMAPSEDAVGELLDEVRSTADNLKRRPLPDEMLLYKKAVRNFIHYVVENSYEVGQFQGIKRKVYVRGEKRWDAKVHHQVRVVDQKLEELAAGILLKQINELDLKNRVEEITGLLVDLTITGKITQE